jgi:hypothetical protein
MEDRETKSLPWERMPCEICGSEYQAARAVPSRGPYVCPDCKSRASGHRDGVMLALGVALSVQASGGSIADAIREIKHSLGPE